MLIEKAKAPHRSATHFLAGEAPGIGATKSSRGAWKSITVIYIDLSYRLTAAPSMYEQRSGKEVMRDE